MSAKSKADELLAQLMQLHDDAADSYKKHGAPEYNATSGGHRRALKQAMIEVIAASLSKPTVRYYPMPESNGRNNWTAVLYSADMEDSFTIDRSEYPHRVRYAADCVRHIIGELPEKPFILDYDSDEQTPCHLCGGTGEKDGKPCHGLQFVGTTHISHEKQTFDMGHGS